jgi:hypothetical protein
VRLAAAFCLCLALTSQAAAGARLRPSDLSLIGAYDAPKGLAIDGAPFGGISGLDYDRASGSWLMISDDRSDMAPARYFRARLDYDTGGVRGLRLESSTPLRRQDGATFPSTATGPGERADAEALRVDPLNGQVLWSTEGDPERGFQPAVRRMDGQGAVLAPLPLPAALGFDPAGLSGARPNKTLEGLSFSPDGRFVWMSMEAPLIQDGPVSTVSVAGLTRITRTDREGRIVAQYAYRLDPVQAATARRSDNGVSEILAIDDHQLLVLERSGVETALDRFAYYCRLYVVEVGVAQDIAGRASLQQGVVRPLAKRLLVNFTRLAGVPSSNLEAMAWGPSLPDGSRTLVLAADDNFDNNARSQFLVFKVRR